MSDLSLGKIVEQLDAAHRDLARLAVNQAQGFPSALGVGDILESRPSLLKNRTIDYLKKLREEASNEDIRNRSSRALFGCIDLTIEQRTASLGDMLKFYMEHGRMNIDQEKIPALDIIPWLQKQDNFEKRELMRVDSTIFLKKIINPILLGITELTVRTVKERFGYDSYAHYCEDKKQVSFDYWHNKTVIFLDTTQDNYGSAMSAWVENSMGRPFKNINRYHALRLLRIDDFDDLFHPELILRAVSQTLEGLGLDLFENPNLFFEIENSPLKNNDALCVAVDIPHEIHIIMQPVGGLLDLETLLHEVGHAAFLSSVDPSLPIEYRRLYRSSSLDESFAFLFMGLAENPIWLTKIVRMNKDKAETLSKLANTKRLCLIRRYIGKFLAEKEYFEKQDLKDSSFYCHFLEKATGFEHEPEGYLIDMETDFYSLDYVMGWSGAHILQKSLEAKFGEDWFIKREAGTFLREIAFSGRKLSLDEALEKFCASELVLPSFS